MKEKILIVEDEFIVANDLQMVLKKAGYQVIGIADSMKQALAILDVTKADLVLLDIYLKGRHTGIDLAEQLQQRHIPFIYISANSNEKVLEAAKQTQPYGFIVKPYRDSDVLLSIDIARYRFQHNVNLRISGELYMQSVIEELSRNSLSWEQKLLRIVSAFQPYIPFDFVSVTALASQPQQYKEVSISRTHFSQYEIIPFQHFLKLTAITPNDYEAFNNLTIGTATEAIYTGNDFETAREQFPLKGLVANAFGLESNLVKPIALANDELVVFSFYSRIREIYNQEHLDLLKFLQKSLQANLTDLIEPDSIQPITPRPLPAIAKNSFKSDAEIQFEGIIGSSTALLKALDQIKIVAPTDTSVLITGESGTGKEMVAANLHRLSARRSNAMITVNCAALPADLIESLLFGHEKGSFTGATEMRIGKFEEADGGTIFLDEIGEMPFELQSKLLRVLQEKEIERIGSASPISINLRIIAATNRNLEKEIACGRFRLDLYYRLNVFPIHLPPLRDRKSDIPELTDHFIARNSKRLKKDIKGISKTLLNKLTAYQWPGNVRELEHMVERAVLLCQTAIIDDDLFDLPLPPEPAQNSPLFKEIRTIEENERDHIISVLNRCNGKISGDDGAAKLLGIPATTLSSKMKKLGIKR